MNFINQRIHWESVSSPEHSSTLVAFTHVCQIINIIHVKVAKVVGKLGLFGVFYVFQVFSSDGGSCIETIMGTWFTISC